MSANHGIETRRAIVKAMGAVGTHHSVQQIAAAIGKGGAHTLQMLYVLFDYDVVERRQISAEHYARKQYTWALSGRPPIEQDTIGQKVNQRFDARPLMRALGMPMRCPLLHNARVVIQEGKRV